MSSLIRTSLANPNSEPWSHSQDLLKLSGGDGCLVSPAGRERPSLGVGKDMGLLTDASPSTHPE